MPTTPDGSIFGTSDGRRWEFGALIPDADAYAGAIQLGTHRVTIDTESDHAERLVVTVRCGCGWEHVSTEAYQTAPWAWWEHKGALELMEHLRGPANGAESLRGTLYELQDKVRHLEEMRRRRLAPQKAVLNELTAALGAEKAPSKRLIAAVRALAQILDDEPAFPHVN